MENFIDYSGHVQKPPYEVVSVNKKPYIFLDLRTKTESIPDGLLKYEVADDGSSGRFCRIKKGIMVNFWGTIIGKEQLPMEDGEYFPKMDEKYDLERDAYEESVFGSEDFDSLMEAYDQEHFPEDEDGAGVGCVDSVRDYLDRYDELKEMCEE